MKKTVRIRKAKPGETPGYVNKTKKFLQKAQTGMSVQESAGQQQRMQKMYMSAYNSLMNDTPADVVYYNLINEYGVDGQTANIVLQSAFQQLVQEGYINPEAAQNSQEQQEQQEEGAGQAAQLEGSGEQVAEQAEEQELMMSEEDDSHIYDYANEDSFDEQAMQQEAFKQGGAFEPHYMYHPETGEPVEARTEVEHLKLKKMGYLHADEMQQQSFQKGGYYFPMMNEGGANPHPTLDQYDRAGQSNTPNFSLDELIQQQAGIQLNNPQGSQISDYIGNYQPVSSSWNSQNWLAKKGGSVPELPKALRGIGGIPKVTPPKTGSSWPPKYPIRSWKPWRQGYDWYNQIAPMQNVSGLGKTFPALTALGYGLHKTPGLNWMLGMKAGPQQDSYITQNVTELSNVLQGSEPSIGVFSKNVTTPDELSVDRLMFATEDLHELLRVGNTEGRSSFTLGEVFPNAAGTIGGIYPQNSKISLGEDDAGNKFFDISHTYKPGDVGSYFSVPSNAKSTSFRNRFYYSPDPEKGFQVFDGLGNPLESGTNNLFQVTRPLIPSLYRGITGGIFNQPGNTLGTSGIMGLRTGPGVQTSNPLKGLISREEITSLPPQPFNELSTRGKIGRGLEQLGFQYGTFPFGTISSAFGYNPIRTRAQNITDISEPASVYVNQSKPGLGSPLNDVNTAEDILNNTNYFRRKGLNTALGLGLTGYLGYNIWDAIFGEDEPPAVGDIRTLLPRDTRTFDLNEQYQMNIPDSLKDQNLPFLNEQNYYRNQNNWEMPDWDTIPENYKDGGKVSKKKFTKQLLAFYNEGGENSKDPNEIGRGNRMDTGVKEVKKIKDGFLSNLKEGSNKAATSDIYDLAKDNPQIMQTLMQDGMTDNLAAEDTQDPNMPEAKWGMSMGDVPSWYTGYMNNMLTPRQYKKLFKRLKKMMPRGVDISRAGYASSIGGYPYPGATLSSPGYMSMFNDYAMGNYLPFMGGYGTGYRTPSQILDSWSTGRRSSQDQAKEVEIINNTKGTGGRRSPIVGETWDSWWTSNGSTPGFRPDKRKWNGSEWVHSTQDLQQFQGGAREIDNSDIQDYQNFFNSIRMQQGGFVNMNSDNPLTKFIAGGMESDYYEPYLEVASDGITISNDQGQNVGMPNMLSYEDWKADQLAQGDPSPDTSQAGYDAYKEFYMGALKDNMGNSGTASSSTNNQNRGTTNNNCPPGYMFSQTQQTCVPMMQFRPHYRRGPNTAGGFFGALKPWNPAFRRSQWTKQMTTPYFANTGQGYGGDLGNMVGRKVTKTNWRGRPKKWTEYYDPTGSGLTMNDLQEQTTNTSDNKGGIFGRRNNKNETKNETPKMSRRDEDIQGLFKSDPTWNQQFWDETSRRDKRQALQDYRWDQKDYNIGHRLSPNYELERVRPGFDKFKQGVKNVAQKVGQRISRPFRKGEFGGYLPEATMGISMGMGMDNGPFNDPFLNQYVTPIDTPEVDVDPCANATEAQKMDPNSPCYNAGLVGVDKQSKNMWEINPEETLLSGNTVSRGILGFANKAQMGPQNYNFTLDAVDTMNNAANTTTQKRGNWGATTGQGSGMFRYDQEGQNASGMSPDVTKFGGFMQEGGSNIPYFDEGQEVFMSEEDIQKYLAAGGQVEYLY